MPGPNSFGTAAEGTSFAQTDATTWRITSADGLATETITLGHAATLHSSDWNFVWRGGAAPDGGPAAPPAIRGAGAPNRAASRNGWIPALGDLI
ncbi:hypothetical protein [Sediminicoccus sp. BL-A-41-H5]|uniref:hypothetical protein n=1 Tax=Sediminicoccus sp. BL-A-41-H5 TaxID=3421106 RepID=UPI003D672A18